MPYFCSEATPAGAMDLFDALSGRRSGRRSSHAADRDSEMDDTRTTAFSNTRTTAGTSAGANRDTAESSYYQEYVDDEE